MWWSHCEHVVYVPVDSRECRSLFVLSPPSLLLLAWKYHIRTRTMVVVHFNRMCNLNLHHMVASTWASHRRYSIHHHAVAEQKRPHERHIEAREISSIYWITYISSNTSAVVFLTIRIDGADLNEQWIERRKSVSLVSTDFDVHEVWYSAIFGRSYLHQY